MNRVSVFEKHPKWTLIVVIVVLLLGLYGLASWKIFNNAMTEFEDRNLKTIVHQYYVGKIIDNNIGRFIKLREHRPNQAKLERPSRNYIKNIAPNTVERKYYPVNTDQHGFIGPTEVHVDPDYKIVFLGGSTTECLYMEEKERFPYLVGRLLEQKMGKKFNTYNGGVSANESMHSMNILMNKVLPMHPTVVVFMHNINDLVVLRSQGSYWHTDSLKSHVQTSKNVFTRFELPVTKHNVSDEAIALEFKRNLETFVAVCRIRGIKPVLMTQANRVEKDDLYHHFNDVIRQVGAEKNVLVIDLANKIPKSTEYIYDSYHYTAQGAQLAAQTIASALEEKWPLLS